MNNKKRKVTAIIIVLLLLSIFFTGFNSPGLSEMRNVDILKIFSGGVLTGVLISILRGIYLEGKKS